jgi:hypothetical protein
MAGVVAAKMKAKKQREEEEEAKVRLKAPHFMTLGLSLLGEFK